MNKQKQNSENNRIPLIPFYFARHGETDWNKDNRIMGHTDIPLNEIGLSQARTIAKKLASIGIAHIFSSPLQRALQTSKTIAQTTNTPITIYHELKNASSGVMEGQYKNENQWLREWFAIWKTGNDVERVVEGFEEWSSFTMRTEDALKKALSKVQNDTPILIVGHGPTYWALLYILNAQAINTVVENCDLFLFSPPSENSDQWRVNVLNE